MTENATQGRHRARLTIYIIGIGLAVLSLAACSTTSAIPDGEQLFTGLKATQYVNYEKGTHFDQTQEEMDVVLATTPNASLFGSSTLRSPFPVGLWMWNAFSQSQGGLGRWLSNTFGSKPVYLSYANPALHVSVGEGTLRKRGYFNGRVSYKELPQSNPKKMKLQYTVDMGRLWRIDSLRYVGFHAKADSMIVADSVNAVLHNGDPFNVETLESERQRICDLFRDNGYYYYDKNDAAYMADTLTVPGRVLLRLQLADSLSARATRPWHIGHVTINMRKQMFEQTTDSMVFPNYTFNYSGRRPPIRLGVLLSSVQLHHGRLYSAQKHTQSLSKLNGTGLFSSTNFSFTPRSEAEDCDTLDMQLDCVFDKPYDFYVEAYGKGKTSGKFGPEVSVGLTKRNAFRGGELLNVKLTGSYEWQTGHQSEGTDSKLNSYQYGLEASLELPRIFNPFRQPMRKRFEKMQRRMALERRGEGKEEGGERKEERGKRKEEGGKRKEEGGKRNEERGERREERGERTALSTDSLQSSNLKVQSSKFKVQSSKQKRRRPRFYTAPSTLLKVSSSVINRADYFKRHVVAGELTYNWQPTAQSSFTLTPLNLTYEYMQSHTDRFSALVDSMPYLRTSMADQFIPKASFSYTYVSPSTCRNPITWWTTISEASNLLSLGYMCFGDDWGEKGKTMFKNPYAQFFKIETNFTKQWRLGEKSSVAAHFNGGVVWSYGNSDVAPYTEQFYVGGANSIRAFNARSIGPGRYRSKTRMMSYVEQTGDLKLLANLEYRPHLLGDLYGAVFLDAGNVWLLREDGSDGQPREGGKFALKNLFREMALGTGVGLRYDLGFFMLRIDWGIGLHVPYGDSHGFYNVDSFKDAQTLHLAIGLPF